MYESMLLIGEGSGILYLPNEELFGENSLHLRDRYSGMWDSFIISRIQRVRYLKDIEILIYHLVDTQGNKIKGKVPRDADLNRILCEVLREHETAIRGIRRALR